MFCRFCGTELPDTTRFCPNCYNPCGYEDMQNIPTSNNQSVQNRGTSRKQNIKVLIHILLLYLTFYCLKHVKF